MHLILQLSKEKYNFDERTIIKMIEAEKEGEKIFHSIPSLGIMEKTRRRVEEPKE